MLNAIVEKNEKVHESLFKLYVRLKNEPIPNFVPGQYTTLGLPKLDDSSGKKFLKRAYSLCSSPDNKNCFEFFIAKVDGGELTPRLLDLTEGSEVLCGPKITGTFTLAPVPENSHLVLVGTGTGLAPYLSMIRTADTWKRYKDITIINGVRYEHDLSYTEELQSFACEFPGFQYLPIVSRAEGSWTGERGRIQRLFKENLVKLDLSRSHVFLCGNPGMISETQLLLESFGLKEHTKKEAGNIHIEKYW